MDLSDEIPDVPLADAWVRVYFDDGYTMDFEANSFPVFMEAVEENLPTVKFLSTEGEIVLVIMSKICCINKRTKKALLRSWKEAEAWKRYRSQNDPGTWRENT